MKSGSENPHLLTREFKKQNAIADLGGMGQPGLMSTKQAAEVLGIEPTTLAVWRATNRRLLAYVKVGSLVRYRREDLEKFIADNLCNA